ncbi:MAG: hypothetical protein ACR2QO_11315 [Acidimicrobiales bacterium]
MNSSPSGLRDQLDTVAVAGGGAIDDGRGRDAVGVARRIHVADR